MNLTKSNREIEVIYLHCTATEPGKEVDVKAIRRFHVDVRGFSDIGYHYVVQPDGYIMGGRDIHKKGAHVKGDNSRSIGVSMVGNWDIAIPTRDDPQIWATGELLARLCHLYDIEPDTYGLLLHRECDIRPMVPLAHKSCPGNNIGGGVMRRYVKYHYDRLKEAGELE